MFNSIHCRIACFSGSFEPRFWVDFSSLMDARPGEGFMDIAFVVQIVDSRVARSTGNWPWPTGFSCSLSQHGPMPGH
jgi:hypothetical protein